MDKIKEMFRGIPKWAWWLIGGGVILALFLGFRKSSPAVTSQVAAVPKDTGGKIGDADVASIIDQRISALDKKYGEQSKELTGAIGLIAESVSKQNQATSGQVNQAINAAMGQARMVNADLANQLAALQKQLAMKQAAIPPPTHINTSSLPDSDDSSDGIDVVDNKVVAGEYTNTDNSTVAWIPGAGTTVVDKDTPLPPGSYYL